MLVDLALMAPLKLRCRGVVVDSATEVGIPSGQEQSFEMHQDVADVLMIRVCRIVA